MAAIATPVDVPYTCNGTSYPFQMELKTPLGTITPSSTVTVTWDIAQPTATVSHLPATAQITANSTVIAEGTVSPSGSPLPLTPVTVTATATQLTAVPQNSPMPLPTMAIVVKPTATGTVAIKGGNFALKVNSSTWYTCSPGVSGGPSMNLVVSTAPASTPTGTPTTSSTPSTTPTTTPTSSSPKPTKTHTKIVTKTPTATKTTTKSSKTPKAGADTGGGGDMGPDGRMVVLTGSLLILAAGVGGLVLRRRTISKG
ncbi:hypothetical protein [Nonomuraea guangzhouensis]|uniref:Gram-positive cocci surface proteins LPxTG domain-containing protein n=1 Tax=Nonomuraea guangzhouensis TaxID=1291555 RepID=A0ABW4G5Q7_9ACTN|nr:hypothetical protein [Nonomuraea guangzhouensis]